MSMVEPLRAIDTNVLLRYLLRDVPAQAEQAERLIDSGRPLGLTAVTMAEVAWTLTGPYHHRDRTVVAHLLMEVLARDNIVPIGFDKREALGALLACTSPTGAANFGDALIAACARSVGVREIYSFDRHFSRAGLRAVVPA